MNWQTSAAAFLTCAVLSQPLAAQAVQDSDALAVDFASPPDSAKPRVWWHWMDGNVTQEGIRKDFEWMKRVGIGGVQNFDVSLSTWVFSDWATPRVVPERVVYRSPQWREMMRFAVAYAEELGLEFAIASSAGWSETGGPWVTPEQAMKKYVWSETDIKGGAPFDGVLAPPPAVAGVFQDVKSQPSDQAPAEFYRDSAVIAFRRPSLDEKLDAKITGSAPIDAPALSDGNYNDGVQLPYQADGSPAWIAFTFPEARTIRSMTLALAQSTGGWLEASDDGREFRRIVTLPAEGAISQTLSFPGTTSRHFRVMLQTKPARQMPEGWPASEAPTSHEVRELVLHAGARIHQFEDKAGFGRYHPYIGVADQATPATSAGAVINVSEVIDLTGRMGSDGKLDWTPPPGNWTVLRFGYSLTGSRNRPAPVEGLGLEVDKLNREHVMSYFEDYFGAFRKALGAELIGKRGLSHMLTDSYEAGPANWTDDLVEEFTRRRGYDPRRFLPALAGRIVNSAAESDAFLWDFRRTLGDLIADEHYGQLSQALHAIGMGRYGESHETSRAFVGDGMEVKKSADVPMGAYWAKTIFESLGGPFVHDVDILESASVANLYGRKFVAAESLTAFGHTYGFTPEMLKPIADRMMLKGVNRFVIHTSAHQPLEDAGPGLGLGPFGQFFTRKETWAEQAGPWMSYLSRSSYLLQQGRFSADVLYFYGEDDNITAKFDRVLPAVPAGYAFDFVNADALVNLLSVKDGHIVTPSGMRYRLLVLDPGARRMTLSVLRKMRELVKAGGVIVGAKPEKSPSLMDDSAEFRRLADELWSSRTAANVIASGDIGGALARLGVEPDVIFGGAQGAAPDFVHRKLDDGDVYYIVNGNASALRLDASFRVTGKAPEFWHPDTAAIEPASYTAKGSRTVVPLSLRPHQAVFVVFRKPAAASERRIAEPAREILAEIEGPWEVNFPKGRGAPQKAEFSALQSWTDRAEPGIRYFSGTASYRKTIRIDSAWLKRNRRVLIDLGEVKNIAGVKVNGRDMGIVWKRPYEADLTDALKAGRNTVEIAVTNLWPNRLIGDKQKGATQTFARAAYDPFTAESPLLESGLLGPVRLVGMQ